MTRTNDSGGWRAFEASTTIGQTGSEGGTIVRDEAHDGGARITLERSDAGVAPFAITCGVVGWFFHTRYCGDRQEADTDFAAMRAGLTHILDVAAGSASDADESEEAIVAAIGAFVDRFPT